MSRRVRRYLKARYLKAVAVSALLVVIAAACSSDGFPESYDDQVDPETQQSNVEANWLDGCEVGFGEELAQDANSVCACAYRTIKTEIPFEAFIEANDNLKSDPESLISRADTPNSTERAIVDIVRDCIATT